MTRSSLSLNVLLSIAVLLVLSGCASQPVKPNSETPEGRRAMLTQAMVLNQEKQQSAADQLYRTMITEWQRPDQRIEHEQACRSYFHLKVGQGHLQDWQTLLPHCSEELIRNEMISWAKMMLNGVDVVPGLKVYHYLLTREEPMWKSFREEGCIDLATRMIELKKPDLVEKQFPMCSARSRHLGELNAISRSVPYTKLQGAFMDPGRWDGLYEKDDSVDQTLLNSLTHLQKLIGNWQSEETSVEKRKACRLVSRIVGWGDRFSDSEKDTWLSGCTDKERAEGQSAFIREFEFWRKGAPVRRYAQFITEKQLVAALPRWKSQGLEKERKEGCIQLGAIYKLNNRVTKPHSACSDSEIRLGIMLAADYYTYYNNPEKTHSLLKYYIEKWDSEEYRGERMLACQYLRWNVLQQRMDWANNNKGCESFELISDYQIDKAPLELMKPLKQLVDISPARRSVIREYEFFRKHWAGITTPVNIHVPRIRGTGQLWHDEVELGFDINQRGHPINIRKLDKGERSSSYDVFIRNSLAQWRFEPKRVNGEAVEVSGLVYRFVFSDFTRFDW